MMQDAEVGARRSARIAERMQARAGGVDTASEEEERESGTDTREETSEAERHGDRRHSRGCGRSAVGAGPLPCGGSGEEGPCPGFHTPDLHALSGSGSLGPNPCGSNLSHPREAFAL
ncbi:unnamed protein product [Coccothraustes coccothraustes]